MHETVLKCQCGNFFCDAHRFYTNHTCIDYVKLGVEQAVARAQSKTQKHKWNDIKGGAF